ncbi:hypothetical protein rosag_48500 [Roseisolibacter agri]|uniref:Uncharacterized protein n=1 Tax=Roseisolibacter agri TaxID=2014610 RepID=A0AA37QDI3_9BACT|nr:hypothetical protein rosag_48500 [Roseisolibacter agri]
MLWKVSHWSSWLKYASAFSPPKVIWRTFARCVSPLSGVTARAGDWAGGSPPVETTTPREQAAAAKTAASRRRGRGMRCGEGVAGKKAREAAPGSPVLNSD